MFVHPNLRACVVLKLCINPNKTDCGTADLELPCLLSRNAVHLFNCRADDFNDPIHLERISTLNTFTVRDLGAVRNDSLSTDYASEFYRINEW